MRSTRLMLRAACLSVLLTPCIGRGDEPPAIKELRTQRIGETTYFQVRSARPDAMPLPIFRSGPYSEGDRRTLAQRAQLVPQDTRSSAVYLRFEAVHARPNVQFRAPPSAAPIEGLEFVG